MTAEFIQDGRKDVQRMFAIYQNQSNNDSQENLQKAKTKLQDAYDAVPEDEQMYLVQIDETEYVHSLIS